MPETNEYKPYWKVQAIILAIVIASTITYVLREIFLEVAHPFIEIGLCFILLILLILLFLGVDYVQSPKKYHDWFDGKIVEEKPNTIIRRKGKRPSKCGCGDNCKCN